MAGSIALTAHLHCHWNCRSHIVLSIFVFCCCFAVYADGSICLDILQNRWSPTYDVSSILTSIQVIEDLWSDHWCSTFINWCLLLTVNSLYWMSQIQTVQQTAKQPSSTRKTNGSTRRGFLPSLNRAGVTVDPCFWFMYEHFGSESRNQPIKKWLISQKKMTHFKFFNLVYLSLNCC